MVTSPFTAAQNALAAYRNQPEGGVGVVSGSGNEDLFGKLASIASGFISRTAATTADLLKPSSLAIPGGSKTAAAAAKVAEAGASAVQAAGDGIKAGFSRATLIVSLVLAFVVWRTLK